MAKENVITKDGFEALLMWLDRNRDSAGLKYEKIRERLIRVFAGRGCFEAEELADETISRVTVKLPDLAETYKGEPALYFYGVAHNIHLEWLRKQKKLNQLEFVETNNYGLVGSGENEEDTKIEYACLEKCLDKLPASQRAMILEYYYGEKKGKIEHRKSLGEKLGITENALHVRASRVRANLKVCIEKCISGKN